jgi:hypothetical protein
VTTAQTRPRIPRRPAAILEGAEWPMPGLREPAVGSTGDSYDNALAATIHGLYTAEFIHRRGRLKTRKAVRANVQLVWANAPAS